MPEIDEEMATHVVMHRDVARKETKAQVDAKAFDTAYP